MKVERFKNILQRYLSGDMSQEEQTRVDRWFDAVAQEQQVPPFTDAQHRSRIYADLFGAMPIHQVKKSKPKSARIWRRMAVAVAMAAAVWLFFTFGLGYLNQQYFNNNATDKTVQLIEIGTDIGELRSVQLPDSSIISLNGNTKIAYDAHGFAKKRAIILRQGEAFFAVKRDTILPFSILAGEVAVQVLGTSFNVNYAVEAKRTTVDVKTGRVQVKTAATNTAFLLTPGQGIRFDGQRNSVERLTTEAESSNIWLQGGLLLNGASFEELQQVIFNRYGLTLRSEDLDTRNFNYSLVIPQVRSVEHLMQMIVTIHDLKYRKSASEIVLFK
ncbi:FecR family protein [Sphingobacterium sp. Mn56C]|uniref:FecR family protein n=1 Tax=Sphingobacterium sp. Mn56C TaxID=3395261 RepID=UPI003BEAE7E7